MSLRILGAGSLLVLPKSLYVSLFKGLQRMGISNAIDVASTAVQQAGIVTTIALGGNIVAVSWWIAASTAAAVAAYLIAASRAVPARALLPGLDMDALRLNRSYALRVTMVSILAMIHTHADKLIVSGLRRRGFSGGTVRLHRLEQRMLLTTAVAQAAFHPSPSSTVREIARAC